MVRGKQLFEPINQSWPESYQPGNFQGRRYLGLHQPRRYRMEQSSELSQPGSSRGRICPELCQPGKSLGFRCLSLPSQVHFRVFHSPGQQGPCWRRQNLRVFQSPGQQGPCWRRWHFRVFQGHRSRCQSELCSHRRRSWGCQSELWSHRWRSWGCQLEFVVRYKVPTFLHRWLQGWRDALWHLET